ncbi:hypothetical protein JY98_11440 [Exiguobacterium mexicanum]|nr:hypothetical protein JY98_11440 [Exiguobacterium mexicanum]
MMKNRNREKFETLSQEFISAWMTPLVKREPQGIRQEITDLSVLKKQEQELEEQRRKTFFEDDFF